MVVIGGGEKYDTQIKEFNGMQCMYTNCANLAAENAYRNRGTMNTRIRISVFAACLVYQFHKMIF